MTLCESRQKSSEGPIRAWYAEPKKYMYLPRGLQHISVILGSTPTSLRAFFGPRYEPIQVIPLWVWLKISTAGVTQVLVFGSICQVPLWYICLTHGHMGSQNQPIRLVVLVQVCAWPPSTSLRRTGLLFDGCQAFAGAKSTKSWVSFARWDPPTCWFSFWSSFEAKEGIGNYAELCASRIVSL